MLDTSILGCAVVMLQIILDGILQSLDVGSCYHLNFLAALPEMEGRNGSVNIITIASIWTIIHCRVCISILIIEVEGSKPSGRQKVRGMYKERKNAPMGISKQA